MSTFAAKLLLASALVSTGILATAGAVAFAGPATPEAPPACLWRYTGPVSGWQLVSDGCHGACTAPPGPGDYVGQQDFTPCDATASGPGR
jgi:hypothetical protein